MNRKVENDFKLLYKYMFNISNIAIAVKYITIVIVIVSLPNLVRKSVHWAKQ